MKTIILTLMMTISFNLFAATPSLKFTGYKFTEKAGVSGTFKKIEWKYNQKASSFDEKLKGANVKIDSYSVDAGNSARNTNITNALFKNWGDRYILGEVKSINFKSQNVIIAMSVGDNKFEVPFKISQTKKSLTLKGRLDLLKLGFAKAFGVLSKTCAGLHTGKDGVSKTWSEVDIEITL